MDLTTDNTTLQPLQVDPSQFGASANGGVQPPVNPQKGQTQQPAAGGGGSGMDQILKPIMSAMSGGTGGGPGITGAGAPMGIQNNGMGSNKSVIGQAAAPIHNAIMSNLTGLLGANGNGPSGAAPIQTPTSGPLAGQTPPGASGASGAAIPGAGAAPAGGAAPMPPMPGPSGAAIGSTSTGAPPPPPPPPDSSGGGMGGMGGMGGGLGGMMGGGGGGGGGGIMGMLGGLL